MTVNLNLNYQVSFRDAYNESWTHYDYRTQASAESIFDTIVELNKNFVILRDIKRKIILRTHTDPDVDRILKKLKIAIETELKE